jgi:prepilin-type N-terminal cleavage/methylation domain-containing protein
MRSRRRNRGFTLVEILLAASLTAMLLTAVATAVHGSLQSYRENEKLSTVTQAGRAVLTRLTTEVRNSEDCSVTTTALTTTLTILPIDTGVGLTRIEYELRGGVLYYRKTITGNTTEYALLGSSGDNIRVVTFTPWPQPGTDALGQTCAKSIRVKLVVAVADRQLSLTASADPRRNQLY